LYYTLKNWRDKVCEERNLPIYIVANSASLKDICTYLPLTNQHLQLLSGFGKAKADKYGEEVIGMVQDYCNQHGLESHIELKVASPKRQRKEPSLNKAEKIPSGIISLQHYQQGKTIPEIAKERNLSNGTIEGHLTEFIKTGEVSINAFAGAEKINRIADLMAGNPDKKHSELKSMLGDQFSFTEIKAVANYLLWLKNQHENELIAK
jgi:DNA-binding CsgD family transcriptional regulator